MFESELGCTVEEVDPGWDDPYLAFWGLVAAETDLAGNAPAGGRARRADDAPSGRLHHPAVDGGGPHQRLGRAQGAGEQDVALHARLRLPAHADAGVCALRALHPGAGDHRGAHGAALRLARLHLPAQHDRPAGRQRARPAGPQTGCRWGCRSWAATSTMRWCCAPLPSSRPPAPGASAGRRWSRKRARDAPLQGFPRHRAGEQAAGPDGSLSRGTPCPTLTRLRHPIARSAGPVRQAMDETEARECTSTRPGCRALAPQGGERFPDVARHERP